MSDPAKLKAQMAELAGRFIERTRGEVSTICELIARLGSGDMKAVEPLGYLVHRIHGGGATFGFDELGEHAGEMERLLEPALRSGAPVTGQILQQLQDYAGRLEAATGPAAAAPDNGSSK